MFTMLSSIGFIVIASACVLGVIVFLCFIHKLQQKMGGSSENDGNGGAIQHGYDFAGVYIMPQVEISMDSYDLQSRQYFREVRIQERVAIHQLPSYLQVTQNNHDFPFVDIDLSSSETPPPEYSQVEKATPQAHLTHSR